LAEEIEKYVNGKIWKEGSVILPKVHNLLEDFPRTEGTDSLEQGFETLANIYTPNIRIPSSRAESREGCDEANRYPASKHPYLTNLRSYPIFHEIGCSASQYQVSNI
jgi:hypothetical protein